MQISTRTWLLEPIAFHRDFETRLSREGLSGLRDRALYIWDSPIDDYRRYAQSLPVAGPDDWFVKLDDTYLVDWYRLLMAPFLTSENSLEYPDELRRGLPQLGWHATAARRLARGRELLTLAERHLSDAAMKTMVTRFGWGHKGWLDHEDAVRAVEEMRSLNPAVFRQHRELVPVIENAFQLFESSALKPDHLTIYVAA